MAYAASKVASSGRIRVAVTWGFILPCVFYLLVGMSLYLQLGVLAEIMGVVLSGQPSLRELLGATTLFTLIGIGAIFFHELGHALVLKYRHHTDATISLTAQVGTRHREFSESSRMMALCGPLLQIVYGVAVLIICIPINAFYFGTLACYIMVDALYNLLPFKNYDGYHVFRKQLRVPALHGDPQ